jgi:hypothetical protein
MVMNNLKTIKIMITSNNNFSITSGTTGTITATDTFLGITGTYVNTSLVTPSTRLIIPTPNENMNTKQVKVAVFTITRDVDTNEINSTKFVKELWVERKNGASIDLIVAKQLDTDFDPETTVIKELFTISF